MVESPLKRRTAVIALATLVVGVSVPSHAESFRRACLRACAAVVQRCERTTRNPHSSCVRAALASCRLEGLLHGCPKEVQFSALSDGCVYDWCEFALCVESDVEHPDITRCDPSEADLVVRVRGQESFTIRGTTVGLGCNLRMLPCIEPCTSDCGCAVNGPLSQCVDGRCQARMSCAAP